ncbi:MAG TPA: pyrroline-5-carboxylate reductase [bacterium]|nr:pyrroline-5-carboxylate reductase [bacterium]
MIRKKIGIIGVGNMGQAILEGLFQKRIAAPKQVWVYDKIAEKAKPLMKRWKVHRAASVTELVSRSEIILLAIKPQDLVQSAEEFKGALKASHVLITILAGTPLAKIYSLLGTKPKFVRAMPNLAAKMGQAVTALTGSEKYSLHLAEKIFSGCGQTIRLEEKYFDLVTAISGSGPAYFFLLAELLEKAGKSQGLTEKAARLLAVQTAVGAGLLAQESPFSPGELRAMVTSKGGTTEAALKVLENKNFSEIFTQAVQAAVRRSRELSRK